jgi:hypothetical protein
MRVAVLIAIKVAGALTVQAVRPQRKQRAIREQGRAERCALRFDHLLLNCCFHVGVLVLLPLFVERVNAFSHEVFRNASIF